MSEATTQIVIVGGGTAGWLTACILAADYQTDATCAPVTICLVESPEVKTIGVGEGTWPSMRNTLERIGISETQFLIECDASFKQGSSFRQWMGLGRDDHYYHPFSLPAGHPQLDIAYHWQPFREQVNFTNAVTAQGRACDEGRAPKTIRTPEFAFQLNYGYHLDAGKFARLLQRHGTQKLGIKHVVDHVDELDTHPDGSISHIVTRQQGKLAGSLFIDCTGFRSRLLGEHFQVPLKSQKHVLFNDTALAVQLPYPHSDSPIASATLATAQSDGWIWDIGLPTRRGVGYVFASEFTNQEKAAETLHQYVKQGLPDSSVENLEFRKLDITPGYRSTFWQKNCVAVGLSAGFIEPLEASAIALVEVAAKFISEQLPHHPQLMPVVAARFNTLMHYHWQKIIDFLKLHYVLSKRTDSHYWHANRTPESIPDSLQAALEQWQYHGPSAYDAPLSQELFPAASYQYIWYGMQQESRQITTAKRQKEQPQAMAMFQETGAKTRNLVKTLPSNRELLKAICTHGLQSI